MSLPKEGASWSFLGRPCEGHPASWGSANSDPEVAFTVQQCIMGNHAGLKAKHKMVSER